MKSTFSFAIVRCFVSYDAALHFTLYLINPCHGSNFDVISYQLKLAFCAFLVKKDLVY